MSRDRLLESMGITVWTPRSTPLGHSVVESPMPALAPALVASPPVAVVRPTPSAPIPEAALSGDTAPLGWAELRRRVAGCQRCGLHTTRTQTVFGVGDEAADWMFIGEAPGADEDAKGEPFVGRAGQLLTSMILALGLKREQVFIANILKCRPPSNRDPQPAEVAECIPYLARQIALVQPKIIVCVGRIAAWNLLATETPLAELRGQVLRYRDSNIPVIVTYHPAYLLRSPSQKRKAWDDLKLARATFAAQRAGG